MFLVSWGQLSPFLYRSSPGTNVLKTAITVESNNLETDQDRMYVSIIHWWEVACDLSIGIKIGDLENLELERRNGRYFALLHWMRHNLKLTTSNCLQLDPYCLWQKYSGKNLLLNSVWFMSTFAEVTENECINERGTPVVKGGNLTNYCAIAGNGADVC